MYSRKEQAANLCVLRVSTAVLKLDGVVIADRNAAGGWARFLDPAQSSLLDFDRIYALDWRDSDKFEYFDRKTKKCAEVLIPHMVEPRFLTGAWVVDKATAKRLAELGFGLRIDIDPVLFFR